MAIKNVARFLKRFLGGVERPSDRSALEDFGSSSERSDVTLAESQEPEWPVTQTIPPVNAKSEHATYGSAIAGASSSLASVCTEENQVEQSGLQNIKTDHGASSQDASYDEVQGSTLDISIAEFIRSQVSSTRLINCSRADYLVSTTVRTALSDRDAVERECLKLGNFGKRTLNELNALLDTAVTETSFAQDFKIEAPGDVSAFQIICRLFDNITLKELCSVRPISVRLANGLAGFSHQDNSLGILFRDWSSVRQDLRRQKNMGSKSVDELQELCLNFIEECLSLNGIPDTESRKIAHSILKQEKLAKELSDIAVTALSDATPMSADVLVEDDVQRPEVFAERLLVLLDERSRDVVHRRFGFMDSGAETLEQIAQTYDVTRERIRQLESKALRKLQVVGKSLPLRAALLDYGNDLWSRLAGAKGFVSQIDTTSASQVPASFKLLLSVCEWQLENWLDEHARKWGSGWVPNDVDVDALDAVRWKIADAIEGKPLPRPIPSDIVELNAHTLGMVIDLQLGLQREGYYILPQGVGQRTARRAARLHGSFKTAITPHTSDELASALSKTSRKEGISNRYAAMLATRYPHLFIEADDDEWFAVGTPAAFAPIDPEIEAPAGNKTEDADSGGFTMASFLTEILARTGPLRLTDLQVEALKALPADRSPASIGPSLLMHREIFDRVLPGVYALRGAVPLGCDLLESRPSYLLNSEQARLFAMGRRAGEPWGAYTLWTCEAEYALCSWARQNAEPALLDSLLAVASFDLWPVDDATRAEWKTFAVQKSRNYQLHFQPRAEVGYALPRADRLLAACLEARHAGHFDWMGGNRILNKMADSHVSAGLIVLMGTLGALRIDPAGNWQMPHGCGPKLQELIKLLSVELHDQGKLSWDCEIGRKLLGGVDIATTTAGNWIDPHLLSAMLSSVSVQDDEDVEIDLEELNRLIAVEAGDMSWEADDVAFSPQHDKDTAIGADYRAIEVARTRVVSDLEGEWSLDDITDHSGGLT